MPNEGPGEAATPAVLSHTSRTGPIHHYIEARVVGALGIGAGPVIRSLAAV